MSRWTCLSCGGTYDDVLEDGMEYYHACPRTRINPGGQEVPIVNRRDENLEIDPLLRPKRGDEGQQRQRSTIRHEGKGRQPA